MSHDFIRLAAATPKLKVAHCRYNKEQILRCIKEADAYHASLVVFPELAITGYTCGDLFFQQSLLSEAEDTLLQITEATKDSRILIVLGLPFAHRDKLYNASAFVWNGQILGMVPKTHLPNYGEFYELRYFTPGLELPEKAALGNHSFLFGTKQLFSCGNRKNFIVAGEICADLWSPIPPSSYHGIAGATVIVNLSASNELAGKEVYRRELVKGQSARIFSAYVYACAGTGESTTDMVYAGHSMIGESGKLLAENGGFKNQIIYGDTDLDMLSAERLKHNTFAPRGQDSYETRTFYMKENDFDTIRTIDPRPFIPGEPAAREERCEQILNIQAYGLMKRIEYIGCRDVVVGVSGGLDSTLALIVAVRAFDLLGMDRKGIHAITMPGPGTSDNTYDNAVRLIKDFGASFMEIPIHEAVLRHFQDIGHDPLVHDLTYENAQARERTQILMNVASQKKGFVIGTGDLSELALGFATYNGDHMSMYGVNASVPKTLIRHLIEYEAQKAGCETLKQLLLRIVDTPVSPELLPAISGEIAQETEKIVGPYALHDFFLYYLIRYGFTRTKLLSLAKLAFQGEYDEAVIARWLDLFYKRFFANQYKRSCLPDGPKVGSVALSPRGDWRMPSDAESDSWLK